MSNINSQLGNSKLNTFQTLLSKIGKSSIKNAKTNFGSFFGMLKSSLNMQSAEHTPGTPKIITASDFLSNTNMKIQGRKAHHDFKFSMPEELGEKDLDNMLPAGINSLLLQKLSNDSGIAAGSENNTANVANLDTAIENVTLNDLTTVASMLNTIAEGVMKEKDQSHTIEVSEALSNQKTATATNTFNTITCDIKTLKFKTFKKHLSEIPMQSSTSNSAIVKKLLGEKEEIQKSVFYLLREIQNFSNSPNIENQKVTTFIGQRLKENQVHLESVNSEIHVTANKSIKNKLDKALPFVKHFIRNGLKLETMNPAKDNETSGIVQSALKNGKETPLSTKQPILSESLKSGKPTLESKNITAKNGETNINAKITQHELSSKSVANNDNTKGAATVVIKNNQTHKESGNTIKIQSELASGKVNPAKAHAFTKNEYLDSSQNLSKNADVKESVKGFIKTQETFKNSSNPVKVQSASTESNAVPGGKTVASENGALNNDKATVQAKNVSNPSNMTKKIDVQNNQAETVSKNISKNADVKEALKGFIKSQETVKNSGNPDKVQNASTDNKPIPGEKTVASENGALNNDKATVQVKNVAAPEIGTKKIDAQKNGPQAAPKNLSNNESVKESVKDFIKTQETVKNSGDPVKVQNASTDSKPVSGGKTIANASGILNNDKATVQVKNESAPEIGTKKIDAQNNAPQATPKNLSNNESVKESVKGFGKAQETVKSSGDPVKVQNASTDNKPVSGGKTVANASGILNNDKATVQVKNESAPEIGTKKIDAQNNAPQAAPKNLSNNESVKESVKGFGKAQETVKSSGDPVKVQNASTDNKPVSGGKTVANASGILNNDKATVQVKNESAPEIGTKKIDAQNNAPQAAPKNLSNNESVKESVKDFIKTQETVKSSGDPVKVQNASTDNKPVSGGKTVANASGILNNDKATVQVKNESAPEIGTKKIDAQNNAPQAAPKNLSNNESVKESVKGFVKTQETNTNPKQSVKLNNELTHEKVVQGEKNVSIRNDFLKNQNPAIFSKNTHVPDNQIKSNVSKNQSDTLIRNISKTQVENTPTITPKNTVKVENKPGELLDSTKPKMVTPIAKTTSVENIQNQKVSENEKFFDIDRNLRVKIKYSEKVIAPENRESVRQAAPNRINTLLNQKTAETQTTEAKATESGQFVKTEINDHRVTQKMQFNTENIHQKPRSDEKHAVKTSLAQDVSGKMETKDTEQVSHPKSFDPVSSLRTRISHNQTSEARIPVTNTQGNEISQVQKTNVKQHINVKSFESGFSPASLNAAILHSGSLKPTKLSQNDPAVKKSEKPQTVIKEESPFIADKEIKTAPVKTVQEKEIHANLKPDSLNAKSDFQYSDTIKQSKPETDNSNFDTLLRKGSTVNKSSEALNIKEDSSPVMTDTGFNTVAEPVKPLAALKQISSVIQKYYDPQTQTFTQNKVVVDGGKLGELDIRLKEGGSSPGLLIIVENESVKAEMQRLLPMIAENLQSRGVPISAINIDVGSSAMKNNKKNDTKNNQNKTHYAAEEGADEQTTNLRRTRYYGYNTMDIVA